MADPGPAATAIAGLVLAGGQGRRMGGLDKGLQLYQGVPLALHAARRLATQVSAVSLSANRHLDQYRAWGWPVQPDDAPHQGNGPLAGMLTGLRHCPLPWLACVPCDVPRFPLDLVTRLAAQARQAVLVVYATAPSSAGGADAAPRRHPTCCLLHRSLAAPLEQYLSAGGRRLDAWMRSLPHAEVPFDDGEAFANLNTTTDLDAAQAAATRL